MYQTPRCDRLPEPSCPLGISRLVPQDQTSFFGVLSHIINLLLSKLVRSRWLYIYIYIYIIFFASLWTETNKHAKREFGQYLAISTSRLVNNPYTWTVPVWSVHVLKVRIWFPQVNKNVAKTLYHSNLDIRQSLLWSKTRSREP